MTNEKMREEFEEWVVNIKRYTNLGKCPLSGNYFNPYLRRMWEAWKASRENIEIELPKYQFCPDSEYDMGFKGCLRACKLELTEQGFKVK